MAALALLCAGAAPVVEAAYAEEIDFGQIDKFESLATGTLHVGSPPKTIVDDGERHVTHDLGCRCRDQGLLEIAQRGHAPNNRHTWKRRTDVSNGRRIQT